MIGKFPLLLFFYPLQVSCSKKARFVSGCDTFPPEKATRQRPSCSWWEPKVIVGFGIAMITRYTTPLRTCVLDHVPRSMFQEPRAQSEQTQRSCSFGRTLGACRRFHRSTNILVRPSCKAGPSGLYCLQLMMKKRTSQCFARR